RATEGAAPEKGRFSARRKMEAVIRLLRGEDLDAVSRDLGVTAATLTEWREAFLAAGHAGLKTRSEDGHDEEILPLQDQIGEITMENELLRERSRKAEANLPLPWRRPKA